VEGAIERVALNHALNAGSLDPPSKRQYVPGLRSHHQVLFIDQPAPHQPTQHALALLQLRLLRLGRVIEQVTGQPYASYVQANILAPCGISAMQIAANKESQRAPNEVVCYGQYSEDPYKINITRMDSEGGWIASSAQLVQFLNHVAGAPGIPALLNPQPSRP
jgi:hypothetical protein